MLDETGKPLVKARPYQREMVEESLKRNIICAMDTGSGKTHVAVMRILHELETLPSSKIVWFLAPTVSLCQQQFEYIKAQIPSVETKFLSGADEVDRWTQKTLWDAILLNVRIVVSTYQIIYDALCHGFVKMGSLGMIVFDEVHNCVGKHPGAKIMKVFYHSRKTQSLAVPHILGLTASPVMRSNPASVEDIETTMHAICRTPKKHRQELLKLVKLPVLSELSFQSMPPEEELRNFTRMLASVGQSYKSLKLDEDPYVISLRRNPSERAQRMLAKVYQNRKTWCSSQIKSFHSTSLKVCRELGASATDYYITEVMVNFAKIASELEVSDGGSWEITSAEKQYLWKALRQVESTRSMTPPNTTTLMMSYKVNVLIRALVQEESTSFRGIVFVQERVVASILAHLLSVHSETRHKFRIGTVVGTSAHAARGSNIAESVVTNLPTDTLADFRTGKINLVIATSVLEEGIDVPKCNVVICFQKPANLKSFVQRRGRARNVDSKLIVLLDAADTNKKEWRQLEEDMKKIYENDQRLLHEFSELEEADEQDNRSFRVEKTGAVLDLDSAVAHLYHFCATIGADKYVDLRPEFICEETSTKQVRARVILPTSVDEAVRFAQGRRAWLSEKNAIKDVAYEAYLALYHAGLVNDNMLPLLRHSVDEDELSTTKVETRASMMLVNKQMNPWAIVAQAWDRGDPIHPQTITLSSSSADDLRMVACLPMRLPVIKPFHLFLDNHTEYVLSVEDEFKGDHKLLQPEDTWIMLDAAFGHRFPIEKKQLIVSFESMGMSLQDQMDQNPQRSLQSNKDGRGFGFLVKDALDMKARYTLRAAINSKPSITEVQHPLPGYETMSDTTYASVKHLTRRADFLHKVPSGNIAPTTKVHSVILPSTRCTITALPLPYVNFGLFIPSILHQFSIHLLAETLSSNLLKDIKIEPNLLLTAITATSACAPTNYQRLEFYGDSILKLLTSIQLMDSYPFWHEGYLSAKKDRLVANSRLSRASVEFGLDKFIITRPFTGNKWRPIYVPDLLKPQKEHPRRKMSSKIVADVVESLIGAATLSGGLPSALKLLQLFLPEITWLPLVDRRLSLFNRAPESPLPPTLEPVQLLLGYTFLKPSLLIEALTHASYTGSSSQSLERLEFLGDSILDNIIVEEMYAHNSPRELTHFQMHILRTAMVNADFLAFVCMELCSPTVVSIIDSATLQPTYKIVEKPLHKFLRYTSLSLSQTMQLTTRSHAILAPKIKHAIEHGTHFPWALLARLHAQKFYSDIIEAVLGAVWVDSGSLDICKAVVDKMGILPYLRRIMTCEPAEPMPKHTAHLGFGVQIWHPKEELGVLAGDRQVRYMVSENRKVEDGKGEEFDGIEGKYACTITIGGEEFITCKNGVSKLEVQARAAVIAVRMLSRRAMDDDDDDTIMEAA
ncbi:dicer-like protein-like protein 2 [Amylocarpus encephaloides]|uniref:Dicer-like protein-like protein 2 n=1 Tax=Amylocarpus encephaloides TaxID=45428 RepID=A0A9P7YAV4_9HELO|nr:dicer-like protein-like protein 2 [Amylocarpus encephaloides]